MTTGTVNSHKNARGYARPMPDVLTSIFRTKQLDAFVNSETTQHGCQRTWFCSSDYPTDHVLLLNPLVAGFIFSHLTLILDTDYLEFCGQTAGRFVLQRPPKAHSIDTDFVMLSTSSEMITGNDFMSIEWLQGEQIVDPSKIGSFDDVDKEVRTRRVLQMTINVCEGNEECVTVAHHQIPIAYPQRQELYSEYKRMIQLAQKLYGKLN